MSFLTRLTQSCALMAQQKDMSISRYKQSLPQSLLFYAVQFSSVTQSCPTLQPHELQHASLPCPSPTPGVHSSSRPSSHLILCHPLHLLPSILPSIRVFSSESALHIRWPKYWSFSFSISPSNEYLGFISFRIDWFDLLAVPECMCLKTSEDYGMLSGS